MSPHAPGGFLVATNQPLYRSAAICEGWVAGGDSHSILNRCRVSKGSLFDRYWHRSVMDRSLAPIWNLGHASLCSQNDLTL